MRVRRVGARRLGAHVEDLEREDRQPVDDRAGGLRVVPRVGARATHPPAARATPRRSSRSHRCGAGCSRRSRACSPRSRRPRRRAAVRGPPRPTAGDCGDGSPRSTPRRRLALRRRGRRCRCPARAPPRETRGSPLRCDVGEVGCRLMAIVRKVVDRVAGVDGNRSAGRRRREEIPVEEHLLQRDRGRRERQHRAARVAAEARASRRRRASACMCAASPATSPGGHTRPASHSRSSSAAPDFVLVITGSVAGHRLERDVRRRIVERRQHEHVGGAVARPPVGVGSRRT